MNNESEIKALYDTYMNLQSKLPASVGYISTSDKGRLLKEFLVDNAGVAGLDNPFDERGYVEDKDYIIASYERNVALCNMDKVIGFADRIFDIAHKGLEENKKRYPDMNVPPAEDTVLSELYQCYIAKSAGWSDEDINFMIDKAAMMDVQFISAEHMSIVFGSIEAGVPKDKIDAVLAADSLNVQSLDFYLDRESYDETAVDAILSAKSSDLAYNVMDYMTYGNDGHVLNPKEALCAVQNVNKIHDAKNRDWYGGEDCRDLEVISWQYTMYGDALTDEALTKMVDSYLDMSSGSLSLEEFLGDYEWNLTPKFNEPRRIGGSGKSWAEYSGSKFDLNECKHLGFDECCSYNGSDDVFHIYYKNGAKLPQYVTNNILYYTSDGSLFSRNGKSINNRTLPRREKSIERDGISDNIVDMSDEIVMDLPNI